MLRHMCLSLQLLSYERIATRELVNGPKLSSIRGKVIVRMNRIILERWKERVCSTI